MHAFQIDPRKDISNPDSTYGIHLETNPDPTNGIHLETPDPIQMIQELDSGSYPRKIYLKSTPNWSEIFSNEFSFLFHTFK